MDNVIYKCIYPLDLLLPVAVLLSSLLNLLPNGVQMREAVGRPYHTSQICMPHAVCQMHLTLRPTLFSGSVPWTLMSSRRLMRTVTSLLAQLDDAQAQTAYCERNPPLQ